MRWNWTQSEWAKFPLHTAPPCDRRAAVPVVIRGVTAWLSAHVSGVDPDRLRIELLSEEGEGREERHCSAKVLGRANVQVRGPCPVSSV